MNTISQLLLWSKTHCSTRKSRHRVVLLEIGTCISNDPSSHTLTSTRVLHEMGALFAKADIPWSATQVSASKLASVITLVLRRTISNASGKTMLSLIFDGDKRSPKVIAKEEGMVINSVGDELYPTMAGALVKQNPEMAALAVGGNGAQGKMMWFVGQMMKEMEKANGKGSVNGEKAKEAVLKALEIRKVD